jgi:hypothetical protein
VLTLLVTHAARCRHRYGRGPFPYSLMDQVVVPRNLQPGDYVLSWRWDAEQTKQVWSHCSDVTVVAPAAPAHAPAAPAAPAAPVKTAALAPEPKWFTGGAGHGGGVGALTGAAGSPAVCVGASVGLDVADCQGWADLFDAMDGQHWPADWSAGCVNSLRVDPCGCSGTDWDKWLVCSTLRDFAHITELYLLSPLINGTLSPSITNFKQLQALSIVGTSITGVLPPALGEMTALEMIWLDHNPYLSGPVPSSLLQLPKLSVLELHRSNFSGVLPPLDYRSIYDCTLNGMVFDCPLPPGAETCGAVCK